MLYEMITPSDSITFYAADDLIAAFVVIAVSSGKGACVDKTGRSVDCCLLLNKDPEKKLLKIFGCTVEEFQKAHFGKLIKALDSFAYTKLGNREFYDMMLDRQIRPNEKAAFKKLHENKQRTSINRYVQYAWQLATIYQDKLNLQMTKE